MSEKLFFEQVSKRFAEVTLEHCDKAPRSYHDYARGWAVKPESLMLIGPPGRGKTQFGLAMIREMFRNCPRRIWPRYYKSLALDALLLEASRSEKTDREIIRKMGEEDLIFIDDFGRGVDTDRSRRQFFEILDLRYDNMLPTLITTNFTLEEIGKTLSEALLSRLHEFQFLEFDWEDLRKNV